MGYNYRDLPELIKLAYRIGKYTITEDSLRKATQLYKPTQIYNYHIENCVSLRFTDIIGKDAEKSFLSKITRIYKNEKLGDQLGLKRHNLLLLHGPPGTGKTYMTRAMAGELGFPMICISGKELCAEEAVSKLHRVIDIGKRYKNCIIFIDEAEKLFGNASFGEDNYMMGEFNRLLDGINDEEVKSLFILAVNDMSRIGHALRDRMMHIKFSLPDFNERREFIERKKRLVKGLFFRNLDVNRMAQLTSKMSFRDIEKLWNDIVFHSLDNKTDSTIYLEKRTKEFREVVHNQLVG